MLSVSCFDSMRSNKTSELQACKVCAMLKKYGNRWKSNCGHNFAGCHSLSIGITALPLGTERPDL